MKRDLAFWWRLTRPHSLTASFIPTFLGTAIAALEGQVNWPLFGAMLVATVLIQIATNLFNEYYDYVRGLDTAASVGIGGAIVREELSPSAVYRIAWGCVGVAVAIGLYISAVTSWWVFAFGLFSVVAAYLYTGGPYPIAYSPFGEVVVAALMGVGLVCLNTIVQLGHWSWLAFYASLPVGIFIAGILTANNIRDLDGDQAFGRRTLAILLGHDGAVRYLMVSFVVAYLVTVGLAYWVTPWALLGLVSIPLALRAYRLFKVKRPAAELMPGMAQVAKLNTAYGLLLSLGFALALFV